MAGLIVVTTDIFDAETIRDMFVAFGYESELRGYREAILFGDPRAILLALHHRDLPADRRAEGLREMGYRGLLVVLGRNAPDADVRRRVAEQGAWLIPAISGPTDVVSRVRQLLR